MAIQYGNYFSFEIEPCKHFIYQIGFIAIKGLIIDAIQKWQKSSIKSTFSVAIIMRQLITLYIGLEGDLSGFNIKKCMYRVMGKNPFDFTTNPFDPDWNPGYAVISFQSFRFPCQIQAVVPVYLPDALLISKSGADVTIQSERRNPVRTRSYA